MNKMLIVFLAVCLVSTHAFVKRDAPASDINKDLQAKIESFKNELTEFGANIGSELQKRFNPDAIKADIGKAIDTISQTINSNKPKTAPSA